MTPIEAIKTLKQIFPYVSTKVQMAIDVLDMVIQLWADGSISDIILEPEECSECYKTDCEGCQYCKTQRIGENEDDT